MQIYEALVMFHGSLKQQQRRRLTFCFQFSTLSSCMIMIFFQSFMFFFVLFRCCSMKNFRIHLLQNVDVVQANQAKLKTQIIGELKWS